MNKELVIKSLSLSGFRLGSFICLIALELIVLLFAILYQVDASERSTLLKNKVDTVFIEYENKKYTQEVDISVLENKKGIYTKVTNHE